MEIGNQNIESKTGKENQVFTDEVKILIPVEDEVERLHEELASERDQRWRVAAEFDNYRRRTKRENEKATNEGKRELLTRMLSIADDLDLALAYLDEASDHVTEGLKLVHRRFNEMLRANEVILFKSVGETFNPELHEAFDVINGTKLKTGTVHSEIRPGYFWNDKLLRAALVVVAQ
jgi:molecular chaperone GrpE